MAVDLTEPLVIGVGSRALFDLEAENVIFERDGLEAYEKYQLEHENDILPEGTAFHLIKSLLALNERAGEKIVEVIVTSRNSPNTSLRVFNSIKGYGLDITRAALTGGKSLAPYLSAFKTDLFLSANEDDVRQAVNSVAAALILPESVHPSHCEAPGQIRIAFDGDAVIFAAEAEAVFKHDGLDAFMDHERDMADTPLGEGPFTGFLKKLAYIQSFFPDDAESPIRTALVTARNAPAHERAIKTLRYWNVKIDEAFFLGGVKKQDVLSAFGAHIFFDDQRVHAEPAAEVVPSAVVPYRVNDNLE